MRQSFSYYLELTSATLAGKHFMTSNAMTNPNTTYVYATEYISF